MQHQLIDVASKLLNQKSTGCIKDSACDHHHYRTIHQLLEPSPEAFLINLNYSVRNATAMDSLALLLSIPDNFQAKAELYQQPGDEMKYLFKAMVVYNGGHYMTYVRNVKSKLVFVIDPDKMDRELNIINS